VISTHEQDIDNVLDNIISHFKSGIPLPETRVNLEVLLLNFCSQSSEFDAVIIFHHLILNGILEIEVDNGVNYVSVNRCPPRAPGELMIFVPESEEMKDGVSEDFRKCLFNSVSWVNGRGGRWTVEDFLKDFVGNGVNRVEHCVGVKAVMWHLVRRGVVFFEEDGGVKYVVNEGRLKHYVVN